MAEDTQREESNICGGEGQGRSKGSAKRTAAGIVASELWAPGGWRGHIAEMAFSSDGSHLLTGSRNFAVRVWNTRSARVELLAQPLADSNDDGGYHAGHLSCDILISPLKGVLMPAGSATGGVIVWDCEEGGRRTAELRSNGHAYGCCVAHLASYPNGRYFVSADLTTIKVWSVDDYTCRRTIRSAFEVEILMVSAQSRFIFCGGQSRAHRGVIAVWYGDRRGEVSIAHGSAEVTPFRLLQGHGKGLKSLYAPDNPRMLVTGALDGMTKVWDVPTGTCTRTIWSKWGLQSPLAYAALVNRGSWLLTSRDDGSLQVWGLEHGKCLVTVNNSHGALVTVSRCGKLVAFATGGRVKIINFDNLADRSAAGQPGKPVAYLRRALSFVTLPIIKR